MIQKLKLMILSMSMLLGFALPAAVSTTVLAATAQDDINNHLCQGSNLDLSTTTTCTNSDITGSGKSITDLIRQVINILSVIIGAIAVLMIIVGGFRYVTSSGNAEQTKSARQTIVYAIVGLVIVALAQIIVHFVLNSTANVASS